nr:hypothetical protein [Tanacetum cinerariifolium]
MIEFASNEMNFAPGVKFCAGEGGLRSWEWCGGGGVECRVGKGGEWGWRKKLLKGMN